MKGIIGGTGLNRLTQAGEYLDGIATPYGDASAPIQVGSIDGVQFAFLARHGQPHILAPHAINYRANLWLLQAAGVTSLVAVNAVGGIVPATPAGAIVIPHQLIDYTYGREMSYSDQERLLHIEFGDPYAPAVRTSLLAAARAVDVEAVPDGVYGVTQGPRLETAAEIDRLDRDGCTLVGMTGMPEAALARELEIPYASLCLVVNPAAGRGDEPISSEAIGMVIQEGMVEVEQLLTAYLRG